MVVVVDACCMVWCRRVIDAWCGWMAVFVNACGWCGGGCWHVRSWSSGRRGRRWCVRCCRRAWRVLLLFCEVMRMLTRHASTVRTDLVTDPSPAKMGTGTSRVIFFSPVPVPVTPVPAIPHGFTFPCPSLCKQDLDSGTTQCQCLIMSFFFSLVSFTYIIYSCYVSSQLHCKLCIKMSKKYSKGVDVTTAGKIQRPWRSWNNNSLKGTKPVLISHITEYFNTHPHFKEDPRFEGLFAQRRGRKHAAPVDENNGPPSPRRRIDCPQAGLGWPSAIFAGPGPGPWGLVHPWLALALAPGRPWSAPALNYF